MKQILSLVAIAVAAVSCSHQNTPDDYTRHTVMKSLGSGDNSWTHESTKGWTEQNRQEKSGLYGPVTGSTGPFYTR